MFNTYAEIFADRAGSYHEAMSRFPHARDAEFHAVVEPLSGRGEGLVCDLPCGGGYLAPYLPPGMAYVGVDPADGFLQAATPDLRIRRVRGSSTDVPLGEGAVDHLISLAGLHHEPDLAAVFAEMRRIVRRGGRVILSDVADGTAPAIFLNGYVDRHNPQGHEGRFLDERAGPMLEAAGLQILSDQLLDVPWLFAGEEEAGAFCRNLFGLVGPSDAQVTQALSRELGIESEDGSVRVLWTLRRIVCEAC